MSAPGNCNVCSRNPERMNSAIAECSHIQCPFRRVAWSERPQPAAPAKAKRMDTDLIPLDTFLQKAKHDDEQH